MTSKPLDAEFRKALTSQIQQHEKLVADAIANILSSPIPEEVKLLMFETQSDWSTIPIVAFAMDDASPDETYYDEPFSGFLIDDGGPELVPDGAIDQDKYEDNDIDTYDITHAVLADWFASVWNKCGGRKFGIPAYIGAHDRDVFIDLRTGAKCSASDIWPED
jgi:hypothetical protein